MSLGESLVLLAPLSSPQACRAALFFQPSLSLAVALEGQPGEEDEAMG